MAIACNALDFAFGDTIVFSDFSFSFQEDRVTCVLGPSGCGKSTLLNLFAGLIQPGNAGRILAPRSSYVFQEPRLFPWRTLAKNVAIPLEAAFGVHEADRIARRFLAMVGLAATADAYPDRVSGGQRQRVALARAFAYSAPLVLMDEPFQALDLPLRIQLMDLLLDLLKAEPRTVLMVTHDPREAIYLADRIVVLGDSPARIVFDQDLHLSRQERAYSSIESASVEARVFAALTEQS